MIVGQGFLFDNSECVAPKKACDVPHAVGDWVVVYLVTFRGGVRGNLWILHEEDAKKLCQDGCSKGPPFTWMFCWTSLERFVMRNETYGEYCKDFVFLRDTGKQDADFARLGIVKPSLAESEEILAAQGFRFKVKDKGKAYGSRG